MWGVFIFPKLVVGFVFGVNMRFSIKSQANFSKIVSKKFFSSNFSKIVPKKFFSSNFSKIVPKKFFSSNFSKIVSKKFLRKSADKKSYSGFFSWVLDKGKTHHIKIFLDHFFKFFQVRPSRQTSRSLKKTVYFFNLPDHQVT